MPATLFFAAFLLSQNSTPVQTPATAPAFQTPMTVAEQMRLAITPKLDGVIEDEEWDPLVSAEGLKGYFQWEPGKLHVAGVVPNGRDLLLSLDLRSDGWLVGGDNIEVRIGMRDGQPRISARRVDATQVNGPRWIDLPGIGMASAVAAKSDGTNTTFEASLNDAGLGYFPTDDRGRMSVRLDTVAADAPPTEPFVPRVLTPVQLSFTRSAALPNGLRWNAEGTGETVMPGDNIRIRLTFNGTDKLGLQRLAMRSEGLVRAATSESAVPFPPFDNKGRAFVDYNTLVVKGADLGYRVLRASLTGSDGVTGVMEASYRVAPPLEVRLVREPIRSKPQAQKVKLTYYIKSFSPLRRQVGSVTVVPPTDFHLVTGADSNFFIDAAKGSLRRVFELDIPAGAKGVYPMLFRVQRNGQVTEYSAYINID
ncbi:hypothetical protein [Fimbriimonas ginsengisoli]|uniref:Uncharacterized protein n=1 Tax=Fimbriimonas ginsengisoli Gsoil 348 TaxID=661478 RepID=A0A068NYH6_FIMGI|nr:hypothetical protein [Fimbriimonas ginsengisoli]AIE88145.1 hypothetical protein OP10G_4777 [Fimbriimonas ginsengisoli Gsoil 348]